MSQAGGILVPTHSTRLCRGSERAFAVLNLRGAVSDLGLHIPCTYARSVRAHDCVCVYVCVW